MLSIRGFPLSEIDNWNYGMLIDWCFAVDEFKRKARGDDSPSEYEKYEKLKTIEPSIDKQYNDGELDEESYRNFKGTIADYERRMGR